MGLWCKDYPVVTVERSIVPKSVTLIVPYYESPQFLATQIAHWESFPSRIARSLTVIVVDDGSTQHPAAEVFRGLPHLELFPRLDAIAWRLFQIEEDRPWNWLAARNIGAHHTLSGWLLMTDMDHVVPPETIEACIYCVHRTDTIYGFSRVEHTGKPAQPHANSFLLTKAMYWAWGGYDEALSGYYGTNGDAYRRMAAVAKMAILTDPLIRHEFVGDSSTTQFARKLPSDAAAVKTIVKARGEGWRPKVLSFPYHEVTRQEAVA